MNWLWHLKYDIPWAGWVFKMSYDKIRVFPAKYDSIFAFMEAPHAGDTTSLPISMRHQPKPFFPRGVASQCPPWQKPWLWQPWIHQGSSGQQRPMNWVLASTILHSVRLSHHPKCDDKEVKISWSRPSCLDNRDIMLMLPGSLQIKISKLCLYYWSCVLKEPHILFRSAWWCHVSIHVSMSVRAWSNVAFPSPGCCSDTALPWL